MYIYILILSLSKRCSRSSIAIYLSRGLLVSVNSSGQVHSTYRVRWTKRQSSFKMPRPYADVLRWKMIYTLFLWEKLWGNSLTIICLSENCFPDRCHLFEHAGWCEALLSWSTNWEQLGAFPHKDYIMDCILRTPQIQLHEIGNHIINSTGSAFGAQTLRRAVLRIGIKCNEISRSCFQFCKLYI